MSWGTSNRDGGKTSESGHLRALAKSFVGEVLQGLAVSQRGAGANMSIDIAAGDAIIMRSDGTYGHPVFNDATENKTVAAADGANPRRDIVVAYVDYGQARSTDVSNNTNGVVKTMVITGSPAGSPTDPSTATIQSAVGSGNPFIKLARIRIPAGQSSITNSLIDDMRSMAKAVNNGGWLQQSSNWDAWQYTSWDNTRKYGVLAVGSSASYRLGQRVKFWQQTGGWKYGIITYIPDGSSIGVFFGTDYTLNNERLYLPAISSEKVPDGFNASPDKWVLKFVNATEVTQSNPVTNTWYNVGSQQLSVPPGAWDIRYDGCFAISASSSVTSVRLLVTLSTGTNTETDTELTYYGGINVGSATVTFINPGGRAKLLTVSSNTTYYLNLRSNSSNIGLLLSVNGVAPLVIAARCAYL